MIDLKDRLEGLHNRTFWTINEKGERVPDYNGILAYLVQERNGTRVDVMNLARPGPRMPNISTFQRTVAKEAKRRRKGER